MAGRTVSSSSSRSHDDDGKEPRKARSVQSSSRDAGERRHVPSRFSETPSSTSNPRTASSPKKRAVRSRRSASSAAASSSQAVQSTGQVRSVRASAGQSQPSKSEPGAFVDARKLNHENIVDKTLKETSGRIGLLTRPKVVDFQSRLKEKKSAGRRYLLKRALIAAACIALIATILWTVFLSPVFRLESGHISVDGGNEWVSQTQVMDIAKRQAGKSLVLVSDNEVEEQLKEIPGVSQAQATKRFPNYLHVSVTAQRPAAMLKEHGSDELVAVDGQGRVLNSVRGARVDGIPVIEVNDVEEALSRRAIKTALQVLNAMPNSMRSMVVKVSAVTQDSVTTQLNNGITIIWGDSAEMELKLAIVDKVMNDPQVIGDKHQIDVSAPLRPIIK